MFSLSYLYASMSTFVLLLPGLLGEVVVEGGDPDFWGRLWQGSVMALVYGVIGILLTALGFKVFDWLTPHLDVEKELADKQNIAVAIVTSAIIISIAIIVAVVMR